MVIQAEEFYIKLLQIVNRNLNKLIMKTEQINSIELADLEPFYNAIENDNQLLEDSFEVLLDMVTSYPQTTKKAAQLIVNKYPDLREELIPLLEPYTKSDNGELRSCCAVIK